MNAVLAGAIAGAIATAPMTMVMLNIHRRIPAREKRRLPPKQVTEKILDDLGAEEQVDDRKDLDAASLVNHFAYGAACGAAYGLLSPRIDMTPALKGTLFGLAVWAGSYMGWLPLAGVRPPATERPTSESGMMIAAHIVFGMFLGPLTDRLSDGQQA